MPQTESALREFSRFKFLAAMDEAPTDQFYEGDDKEVRAERIIQRAEYSTYQQLWVIKAFFDPRVGVKEDDVGVCLKDFIKTTYGGSPETMALKRILDSMTGFATMDDARVADLATQLSTCISETTFDSALLNRAVQVNMSLRRWGFEEALTDERLLVYAKRLV